MAGAVQEPESFPLFDQLTEVFRSVEQLLDTTFRTSFNSSNPQFGKVDAGDELPYVPAHQLSLSAGVGMDRWEATALLSLASPAREAAGQGDTTAQLMLGQILLQGMGVPQEPKEAARYIEAAAKNGDAEAQSMLAGLYIQGIVVGKDVGKASVWFEKAAAQGDPELQTTFGLLNANGVFGQADFAAAEKWLGRAAQKGHVRAQMNLGVIQAQGMARPPDLVSAYRWFHLAAMQGEERAAQIRDAMARGATGDG